MTPAIERMTAETVAAAAALERECFSVPWSEAALRAELDNPAAVFLVARVDGAVAGYAGMHHVLDEGNLANVAVGRAFRRRGVGAALLAALTAYCDGRGVARMTLEVRPSNAAAIALYGRFGFCAVGRRRGFYTKPAEDALVMVRVRPE